MFPTEFYYSGGLFPYMEDLDGNLVFIIRARLNQKHPGVAYTARHVEITQKFILYRIEKLVSENPNRKIGIVIDFQKATLANADMKLARFLVNTFATYYYGKFKDFQFSRERILFLHKQM